MTRDVRKLLLKIRDQRFSALRMRVHGDLNLRQALFTGKDFVLIDFEGDPDRPHQRAPHQALPPARRGKHAALLLLCVPRGAVTGRFPALCMPQRTATFARALGGLLVRWVGAAYLAGYLGVPGVNALLPSSREQLRMLLDAFLIEKGMREVRHELNERPAWLRIPVHGILELLDTE